MEQEIGRNFSKGVLRSIDNRLYAIKDNRHPSFEKVNLSKNKHLKDVSKLSNEICPSQTDLGWLFKLDKNEKVSGKVAVGAATLFVPRYTPHSTDICKIGTSKVTAHEMLCGKKKDTIELGEGVVTGVTYYKGTLYGGLSAIQDQKKALVPKDGSTSEDKSVWSKKVGTSESSTITGTVKYESWREIF